MQSGRGFGRHRGEALGAIGARLWAPSGRYSSLMRALFLALFRAHLERYFERIWSAISKRDMAQLSIEVRSLARV